MYICMYLYIYIRKIYVYFLSNKYYIIDIKYVIFVFFKFFFVFILIFCLVENLEWNFLSCKMDVCIIDI